MIGKVVPPHAVALPSAYIEPHLDSTNRSAHGIFKESRMDWQDSCASSAEWWLRSARISLEVGKDKLDGCVIHQPLEF